eukprot:TRINITY_DN4283_c4_g1_i1.p1 TRINITY_DN4283_c4_g1~~TRINITY_DN4283_c4_g1_i1.p1  ORF type:complete len:153 (+),score=38.33 TRINITY_DN4283_c4_g1_i1:3-461(+)
MSGEVLFTGDDLHDPDLWDDTELIEAYNAAVAKAKGYSGKMKGKWSKKDAGKKKKKKDKVSHDVPKLEGRKRKEKKAEKGGFVAVAAPLPLPERKSVAQVPPAPHLPVSLPPSITANEGLLRELTAWYHAGYQAGLNASREVTTRRGMGYSY